VLLLLTVGLCAQSPSRIAPVKFSDTMLDNRLRVIMSNRSGVVHSFGAG
jgi:hypothetical protein